MSGSVPSEFWGEAVLTDVHVIRQTHQERSKLSSRSAICVFLGYDDGQKSYRCYDPSTKKLYVSRHVVYLEHIPFYSLSSDSHITSSSKLIHVDPFGHNDNISSDCNFENCRTDTTATPDTDIPLAPTNIQETPAIVDPPRPRYPSRHHKYTKLSNFVYSTYSTSFASFLTFILLPTNRLFLTPFGSRL
ncbi:hypothetical protein KIW84_024513 [Lathyrus oleraceus]|uniref:Retroviral polymerase SH3-like domain-containing protein n=1 Tax=Pisum sativum TaxID=3888 RepID=A0A9D4YI66_PEA|nr:hypothetical protein KIW84_024513 [Pisum sativum]